jgi:hypothetical protein
MSNQKKVFIYENDLKFNKNKNIDINSDKVFFDSDNLKNNIKEDSNTLEYRLRELKKNSSTSLDLSHMNIDKNIILNLPILYSNIIYLFLNDNNLSGELDLTKFSNLEVIDIENNNLTSLTLPNSITEIVLVNNKLSKLPNNINPIRIKAIKNNLIEIPPYSNLEILELSENNITKINKYDKLRKLIIDSNPIEYIDGMDNLLYLDISDTDNVKMGEMIKLEHLVAISTKLTEIPLFKSLKTIEVINSPIKRIPYFENFELILCSYDQTKNISSKYVDLAKAFIKLKKNNVICISREEVP